MVDPHPMAIVIWLWPLEILFPRCWEFWLSILKLPCNLLISFCQLWRMGIKSCQNKIEYLVNISNISLNQSNSASVGWIELQYHSFQKPTHLKLARACGIPAVGVWAVNCWQWCSGQYNHQSFPSLLPFPIEGVLGSKLILQKLAAAPKNLGVHLFPDHSSH